MTPHNPSNSYFIREIESAGIFNAGFIGFRNTKNGLKALNWWQKKCINKCSNIATNKDYADQKYLNELAKIFKNVNKKPNSGINLAPWNIASKLKILDIKKKKKIFFFHMQAFRIFNLNFFDVYSGNFKVSKYTLERVYFPYIRKLKCSFLELKRYDKSFKQRKEFNFNLLYIFKRLIKNKSNYIFYNK